MPAIADQKHYHNEPFRTYSDLPVRPVPTGSRSTARIQLIGRTHARFGELYCDCSRLLSFIGWSRGSFVSIRRENATLVAIPATVQKKEFRHECPLMAPNADTDPADRRSPIVYILCPWRLPRLRSVRLVGGRSPRSSPGSDCRCNGINASREMASVHLWLEAAAPRLDRPSQAHCVKIIPCRKTIP
jgi:hypothetical protein